ncbi:MAG: uroporphyrinogen decarboxylase family protein [Planctomycetota bacterium]
MEQLQDRPQEAIAMAEGLVAETRAADGLAPVDCAAFWDEQEQAVADPFAARRVPIGHLWSAECIFDELGIPEDWHRYHFDTPWVRKQCVRYNDRAERIVGRRLLNEQQPDPERQWPQPKGLADLFDARNEFREGWWWLMESASDEDGLAALLDRVDARLADLRGFLLPPEWDQEKERLASLGVCPPQYRHQRGPVTFATSIFGVENLCFLFYDDEDLVVRFSRTMLRAMLAIHDLLAEEARSLGFETARGFSFADDNCYLLTPEQYELFAAPILAGVFAHCAPEPGDWRFQHSDSAMEHLVPILARFDLQAVNFGPTVPAAVIRDHMPRTVIQGQLAPFTYSRHDEVGMVAEFLRDMGQLRDSRGLLFATAGSVNNGSRLHGLRLIMAAVQRWGWY